MNRPSPARPAHWRRLPLSLVCAGALILSACVGTRAEERVSTGMTGAQVRRALGEPYSQIRSVKGGVAIDVWLFREVQPHANGSKSIVDSAVTLRDGRVTGVTPITETPTENEPVSAAAALTPY